ncbi:MAG TPA: phosphoglycerate mutase family protein [Pyrinomonadaceae bacterium]|nr:phosphoglycerate mutase family protein [Pyrinomonadaceae bacterium]
MDQTPEPRTRTRTIAVFSLLALILGAVVVFAYFSTFARPVTTVIVVRHAEKNIELNNPDPDLSPAGQVRAQEIARMFDNSGVQAIYATQYKRTQQTVAPLASKLGVPVVSVEAKQSAELARRILSNNRGQTVFVAGHNNTAPEIVNILSGENYPQIPESEYDNMFIVTIYRFGKARVLQIRYGAVSTQGVGTGTMIK